MHYNTYILAPSQSVCQSDSIDKLDKLTGSECAGVRRGHHRRPALVRQQTVDPRRTRNQVQGVSIAPHAHARQAPRIAYAPTHECKARVQRQLRVFVQGSEDRWLLLQARHAGASGVACWRLRHDDCTDSVWRSRGWAERLLLEGTGVNCWRSLFDPAITQATCVVPSARVGMGRAVNVALLGDACVRHVRARVLCVLDPLHEGE